MAYATIVASASDAARRGDREGALTTVSTDIQTMETALLALPNPSPPSTTPVADAVAVLVAEGAIPTQASVNALNSAWGTFLTAENTYRTAEEVEAAGIATAITRIDAIQAIIAARVTLTNDLIVSYDAAKTLNQIRDALRKTLFAIEGTF